jgi:hypothetical protein
MADFSLRGITDDLAEGIKAHAREHGIPLNQAILDLIRLGLSADTAATTARSEYHDPQDIASLAGTWNGDEMQAFRAAIAAMEKIK